MKEILLSRPGVLVLDHCTKVAHPRLDAHALFQERCTKGSLTLLQEEALALLIGTADNFGNCFAHVEVLCHSR